MKKIALKKHPLLISIIISSVIIVLSLFILGFFGMRLSFTLSGGSQFDVQLTSGANSKEYTQVIKEVLSDNGLYMDSAFVEDKYIATEKDGEFTKQCLVVNIASSNISEETKQKIIDEIIKKLNLNEEIASAISIETVTSSIKGRDVLFIGLAIGIVALALFIFAWVRHNIFAGLSFIIAFLHNIILYLAILILTRVELSLMSLSMAIVLTIIMSLVMIHIYEKFREVTRLKLEEKMSISERMISSETEVVKPFVSIAAVVGVVSILLLFVPVASVKLSALSVLFALIVSAYTGLIVGPGTYASLLEVKDLSLKATLSRNDSVNKEIKKKIKKSAEKESSNSATKSKKSK